jgi:hypothetical protein
MLVILDKFFFVFHSSIILLILFGWMWKKTRKLNLLCILLTAFSWFILGIWYGYGYCPCTDWHWQLRIQMGYNDMPSSYIGFLIESIFAVDVGEKFIDVFALILLILAASASFLANLRDWRVRKENHDH